jgi:hypothetical protein
MNETVKGLLIAGGVAFAIYYGYQAWENYEATLSTATTTTSGTGTTTTPASTTGSTNTVNSTPAQTQVAQQLKGRIGIQPINIHFNHMKGKLQ